jgi:hypothetical protein
MVLNRDAVFSGPSLWHVMDSTTSDIFTRGTVTIRLERFEFAQNGEGTYGETVSIVERTNRYEENCTTSLGLPGRRWVEVRAARTQRPSRRVTWQKLPDGRVEIRAIGIYDASTTSVVATVSRQTLGLQYTTAIAYSEAKTIRYHCYDPLSTAMSTVFPIAGPVPSTPLRRVEWSLARATGT